MSWYAGAMENKVLHAQAPYEILETSSWQMGTSEPRIQPIQLEQNIKRYNARGFAKPAMVYV